MNRDLLSRGIVDGADAVDEEARRLQEPVLLAGQPRRQTLGDLAHQFCRAGLRFPLGPLKLDYIVRRRDDLDLLRYLPPVICARTGAAAVRYRDAASQGQVEIPCPR